MVTLWRRTRAALRAIRRTPRSLGIMLALGATVVGVGVAVAVAGDGGVPGDAVAVVDGDAIDRSELDHWLSVAARSGGRPDAQIPKPPDFAACVKAKRELDSKPDKGKGKEAPKRPDSQLKDECRREYEDLRDRAMQLLISQRWIEGEARELDVAVSDDEVKKSFDEQRKRSFPKDADYRKWLEQSGQSEEDIRLRVRYDLLSNKIRDRMTKGDDKVTDEQIADYYDQHKARFGEPPRRDVRIVLAESRAKALQAKRALERGTPWRSVAKRYSIDGSSRLQGGSLRAVEPGTQDPPLDKAVFKARKGRLVGPVRTQFGWYVLEVTKIDKGSPQTLAEAKASVKQLLLVERRQKRLDAYVTRFREKWRERTECRAGYVMADCKNTPKPTPTPTMRQP
jgi:foldase protein PrsA